MGKIVSAYATSHILFSPEPAPEKAREIVDGMTGLGARVIDAKPDVILFVTSDHMFNLNLSFTNQFCVGVADEYMAMGDMAIPQRPFKGHREFATGLLAHCAENGFDIVAAEEVLGPQQPLVPDHAVTLPLLFIKPWGRIPAVPLYTNIHVEPYPTPEQCIRLGGLIREFVDKKRPAGEKVAVVGSGGLSHWLNIPGMGNVAEDYDQECLDLFVKGKALDLGSTSTEEIFRQSGNGGLELLNWIAMAATVPGSKGERAYYVPMIPWQTGMAGVVMKV